MFRKIALSVSVLLAGGMALPALSADLADRGPADWAGLYFGGQLGWSHGKMNLHDLDGYNGPPPFSYKDNGVTGRAYMGYNFQQESLVFSPEIGLGFLGIKDSQQYPPYIGVRLPSDSAASMKAGFFASVTGRIGIAWDRFLLYGRGGWIGARMKASFIDNDPTGTILVSGTSRKKFKSGYTVGGGLEWALTDQMALRLEYMYADLGKITHTAVDSFANRYKFRHDMKMHRVMVGVTARF